MNQNSDTVKTIDLSKIKPFVNGEGTKLQYNVPEGIVSLPINLRGKLTDAVVEYDETAPFPVKYKDGTTKNYFRGAINIDLVEHVASMP